MAKIIIDKYLCVRCGQCIRTCPGRLFQRHSASEYPSLVSKADESCISCNHCLAVCPVGAVSIGGIDSSSCLELTKESVPRFEHIATLARMRRSIRRYSDKPLDDRVIEQLLDVVRWAPTAKNRLPVKWLVINNREKVQELEKLVANWVRKQPNLSECREATGEDGFFRSAPCVVAAYTTESASYMPTIDATIALETLDLCVTAMRLGACWAGYFLNAAQHDQEIKKWLGLTEADTVQGGLMLGYTSDEAYQRIPYRPELNIRWIK